MTHGAFAYFVPGLGLAQALDVTSQTGFVAISGTLMQNSPGGRTIKQSGNVAIRLQGFFLVRKGAKISNGGANLRGVAFVAQTLHVRRLYPLFTRFMVRQIFPFQDYQ